MKSGWFWKLLTAAALFSLYVSGCDQFVLWEELDGSGALSLAPASASVSTNGSIAFVAAGGVSPYSFSVSGAGSIDPATGLYTAPAGTGTDTISVTDADGTIQTATVTITSTGSLGISPSAVTLATNGSLTFVPVGGVGPYSFSVVSGIGSVDPATGDYDAPAAPGSATVRVTDSDTPPATADASVTVTLPASLAISPSSLVLDTNNSVDFEAFGGVTPYAFSIIGGGGSIDPVTGLYNAPASADNVTVRVTDSDTPPSTDDATVTVYEPFTIVPTAKTLIANSSFTFTASGGKSPYAFSKVSGGGSINTTTGLYTAPGAADTVVVRATDDLGHTSDATVTVSPPQPLVIDPASKSLLANDTFTFSASGGTPPYAFTVLAPASGSINVSTGLYTAPASAAADTVRVTDALSATSDATVTVIDPGPLAINPSSATVPVNGERSFSATGGAPPYTFSVAAGSGTINAATGLYRAPSAPDPAVTVRVTDSALDHDEAAVTVSGSGCGQIYPESEPPDGSNDDKNPPWTNTDDFGILLVPGCSTTIAGTTDPSTQPDVFKFNTGSASFITFIALWSSGGNELDIRVYDSAGNKLTESKEIDVDSESHVWAADTPGADRYIELEVKGSGGVDYTLIISGN